MSIRSERPDDRQEVHSVHRSAFETRAEADLVDRLRPEARPIVSLVAETADGLVGHILFTPVRLATEPHLRMMGLAPMAVRPLHQGRGIGSQLVAAGLDRCRELGAAAVVVLGHPEYYPRFGFAPASRLGLSSEYDVPDEIFMAMELEPGVLGGRTGQVRYHDAFRELG